MPITVSVEYLASNLYNLINKLEAGTLDQVHVVDGQAVDTSGTRIRTFSTPASLVAKLVLWDDYVAADAYGLADSDAGYQGNLQVQSGGWMKNAIYQAVHDLREMDAAGTGSAAYGTALLAGADANGDVTYTAADPGPGSSAVTIEHVVAGISTPFSIDVVGTVITVNVETDGGGAALTTGGDLPALIAADPDAAALVTAVAEGTGLSLLASDGPTALAGGTDPLGADGPRVIALKRSKNDTTPRAALVAGNVATAIGL